MKKMSLQKYLKIIGISLVGAVLITYLTCRSCARDSNKFLITSSFTALMWVVMWLGNENLTCIIDTKISWVKHPVRRFVVGVIATVIFTVIVAIGLARSYEYALHLRFGNYNQFIIVSLIITFLISFFLHGREFLLRWREAAVEAERYQKENMMAQYKSLKSQVDPHFLFNSLNVLTNLVYEDADKSARFIKQLSEVYRYVLDTRSKELVTLEEELKFVNAYLYLQQIRFGDKLIIDNEITDQQGLVPPLVIQMLAENAIKHNEVSQENPLQIHLYREGDYVVVANTLQIKKVLAEDSKGIGLENIRQRYAFLTEQKVTLMDTEGRFVVKLPLIKND